MLTIFCPFQSHQMTGVSVLQYYSPAIFASIGFGTEKTFLFQSINSIIALFGEAACMYVSPLVSSLSLRRLIVLDLL